jgi:hypothetical protein
MKTIRNLDRQIKKVKDMKLLVKQLTRIDDGGIQSSFKKGVFIFTGVSKILFGTMDSEDASY